MNRKADFLPHSVFSHRFSSHRLLVSYAKQICLSRPTLSGQSVYCVVLVTQLSYKKIPILASVKFAMVYHCTMGVFISELGFFKC